MFFFQQGLPDGSSAIGSTSEQSKLASKFGKKSGTSGAAANTNLSASLDLTDLDNAMANMEKVILQNVYHDKMLLYRDHQVSYNEGSSVSRTFLL